MITEPFVRASCRTWEGVELVDAELKPILMMAVYSVIGLVVGLNIRLMPGEKHNAAFILRRYGKIGSLMIGFGGCIITVAYLIKYVIEQHQR